MFSLLPLFPLVLFLVFLLKWLSSSTTTARPPHKNPPSSPRKLPKIRNFHQLSRIPHHSIHSLSQTHGPLMLLHFATSPVLIVSSTATARAIMKTPRPNLLEPAQIENNDQIPVRVLGHGVQPLQQVLEAAKEHLRPPVTKQHANPIFLKSERRRDGGCDREDWELWF